MSYAGYYFIDVYQIEVIKERAASKMVKLIPDNTLTKIEEDKALKWKGDDELWFDNQMFDVVKRIVKNGKVYLMCIADADEAAALKKLADLVHSDSNADTNGNDKFKIINSLQDIFCDQFYQIDETLTASSNINYFNDYSSQLSELTKKITVPPPKI